MTVEEAECDCAIRGAMGGGVGGCARALGVDAPRSSLGSGLSFWLEKLRARFLMFAITPPVLVLGGRMSAGTLPLTGRDGGSGIGVTALGDPRPGFNGEDTFRIGVFAPDVSGGLVTGDVALEEDEDRDWGVCEEVRRLNILDDAIVHAVC